MIHEYNCKRCGKYDWHYADDCLGEHPRHCAACAAAIAADPSVSINTFEELGRKTRRQRDTLNSY